MPHGTGKKVRVAVFTQGKNADAAREAGADIVGLEDLAEKVKAGQIDFDVVVASPDAMRVVGGLGQILGPRGLMPNPKVGTVTPDVAGAVRNAKAGQVRYRCDKAGIVHCTIGKASFQPAALRENLIALLAVRLGALVLPLVGLFVLLAIAGAAWSGAGAAAGIASRASALCAALLFAFTSFGLLISVRVRSPARANAYVILCWLAGVALVDFALIGAMLRWHLQPRAVLLLAALKQREVDERIELTDADVLAIIEKMIKQRRDSIEQFEKGRRQDLADKEQFEIAVLQGYMPAAMSAAEVDAAVTEAIAGSGAKLMADMGKVMAVLKPKLAGRADMGKVSALVKTRLSG